MSPYGVTRPQWVKFFTIFGLPRLIIHSDQLYIRFISTNYLPIRGNSDYITCLSSWITGRFREVPSNFEEHDLELFLKRRRLGWRHQSLMFMARKSAWAQQSLGFVPPIWCLVIPYGDHWSVEGELVLLPTSGHPLLVRYHGPYGVAKKVNGLNYVVKTHDRL